MKLRITLWIVSAVVVASCTHTDRKPEPLIGSWIATSENAAGSAFEFRSDGSATWHLEQPFEIRYRVDDPAHPTELDLAGFQTGPLKGRTLYCLVELLGDALRIDCESKTRPESLDPEQTQVFSRQSGGA